MATLSENINSTITSLEAIKQAVITKGGSIPTGTPLSSYASLILAMPAGTYTGCKSTQWIDAVLTQDATPYYTATTATTTVTPNMQWTINTATNTANVNVSTSSCSLYWLYNGTHNNKMSMGAAGIGYANTTTYDFSTQDYANYVLPARAGMYYSSSSYNLYRLLPVITVPSDFVVESNTKLDILGYISIGSTTSLNGVTFGFKYRLWTPSAT